MNPIRDFSINILENNLKLLSDSELKKKTNEFREKINNCISLDEILPEAFAVVRETSKRTIQQRHFDVQLIGGIVLHKGMIAEMKTGEGKTLVATLTAYLNSLNNKPVHIITVNDYLAERDSEWMGEIYKFLGIPPFKHRFTNLEQVKVNGLSYDDTIMGKGVHTIKTKKLIKSKTNVNILPKEIIKQYGKIKFI